MVDEEDKYVSERQIVFLQENFKILPIIVGCLIFMIIKARKLFKKSPFDFYLVKIIGR